MKRLREIWDAHGEKIALGLGGFFLVAWLLLGAFARAPQEIPKSAGLAGEVEKWVRETAGSGEVLPDAGKETRRIWLPTTEAAPGTAWASLRPVVWDYRESKPVEPEKPIFESKVFPAALAASVDVGVVNLSWTDNADTNLKVSGYDLERKGKDGKWTKIVSLPADKKAHVDTSVDPKSPYAYRVTILFSDERAVNVRTSPPSPEAAVQTLGVVGVKLLGTSNVTGADGQAAMLGRAQVRKLVQGEWLEHTFTVRKGDKIGGKVNKRVGGRMQAVDMGSGFLVLDIVAAKVTKTKSIRVPKKGPDGKPDAALGFDEQKVDYELNTTKLIYKDDEGKTLEIFVDEHDK